MLSFALVLIVGLGSIGLYLTAYIYPEINRKTDVWWSGIGLFYALILLVYRRPVGLLLGHTASVILLVWLSYQAVQRRWAMVEANPPQPEAGTLSAQARDVLDQVVGKITGVDWQGLWKRMGTQADDGTAEKSILPPTIKQRLDFSGLGDKLKGMIGGKDKAKVSPPPEPISSDNAESSAPAAVDPPSKVTPAKDQPSSPEEASVSKVESPPPVESALPAEPVPPIEKVAPVIEQPSSMADDTPIPDPVDEQPVVEVIAETVDQPEAKKAELAAELDQVISDLSTDEQDGQDTASSLPQPPDPLG